MNINYVMNINFEYWQIREPTRKSIGLCGFASLLYITGRTQLDLPTYKKLKKLPITYELLIDVTNYPHA